MMSRLLFSACGLVLAGAAWAGSTQLKQVQVSQKESASQVDFLFDGKVAPAQIKTEYINDIIQLVIQDVSIYPAKIAAVESESLTKVFAYQFSPKVVRCRLSVKGKAEDYKDKFELHANGKMLTVKLRSAKTAQAAAATEENSKSALKPSAKDLAAERQSANKNEAPPVVSDPELLHKISEEPIHLSQAAPTQKNAVASDATGPGANANPAKETITSKNAASSPVVNPSSAASGSTTNTIFRSLGKLALFFGFFGILALLAKKFLAKGLQNGIRFNHSTAQKGGATGIMGAISRFATAKLSGRGKLIEIVATHSLGPKRSIHIVRVGEKTLVIGSTAENINLISELDSEGETSGLIQTYSNPAAAATTAAAVTAAAARAQANAQNFAGPDFSRVMKEAQGDHGPNNNYNQAKLKAYIDPNQNPARASAGEATESNPAYQALQKSIRGQIKSKLEGLKPL